MQLLGEDGTSLLYFQKETNIEVAALWPTYLKCLVKLRLNDVSIQCGFKLSTLRSQSQFLYLCLNHTHLLRPINLKIFFNLKSHHGILCLQFTFQFSYWYFGLEGKEDKTKSVHDDGQNKYDAECWMLTNIKMKKIKKQWGHITGWKIKLSTNFGPGLREVSGKVHLESPTWHKDVDERGHYPVTAETIGVS